MLMSLEEIQAFVDKQLAPYNKKGTVIIPLFNYIPRADWVYNHLENCSPGTMSCCTDFTVRESFIGITQSSFSIFTEEEFKSHLAHEMGHVILHSTCLLTASIEEIHNKDY